MPRHTHMPPCLTLTPNSSRAICVKNAVDFLVATIFWLILGYPLAFGKEGELGHFGGTSNYFGEDVSAANTDW